MMSCGKHGSGKEWRGNMNKKEILFITGIMLITMTLTISIVTDALTGSSLTKRLIETNEQTASPLALEKCSSQEKIQGLNFSNSSYIKKLHTYQELCDSFVTNRLMVFTDMPKDAIVAREKAANVASTLMEFSYYGLTPLVIVEPVTEWGLIDFEEFKSGFYNDWIRTYFAELKKLGITDSQMGIWVPFPEANLPYWNHANANPEDFAIIVNTYLSIMKEYFPEARGSILLNSATYDTDDFDWANGEYLSLLPYVSGLNASLVDSFGLQGFPWSPPAGQGGAGIYNPREFLNSKLVIEAAQKLGVKEVWLNTGTYRTKYTSISEDTVAISASMRKDIFVRIASEAELIQRAGYSVWINIFSEDKSSTVEATDWSYITKAGETSQHAAIFTEAILQFNNKGINVSLFDQ